jgi:hypothetical protein
MRSAHFIKHDDKRRPPLCEWTTLVRPFPATLWMTKPAWSEPGRAPVFVRGTYKGTTACWMVHLLHGFHVHLLTSDIAPCLLEARERFDGEAQS